MQRPLGGYTLIEVMMFLAITSVLFTVSIVAIRGQAGHTEFVTSMSDINVKMQQWVDQVVNGYSSNDSTALNAQYQCLLDAQQYPQLTIAGGKERGSNYECVFLGKVIQVNTENNFSNRLYAYNVLGRRASLVSGVQESVSALADSKPIAAIFPQPPTTPVIDLTEEYQIPNGTRIVSAKSTTPGYESSQLAGFFTGFNTDSNNGAASLATYNYALSSNSDPRSSTVTDCIKLLGPCAGGGSLPIDTEPCTHDPSDRDTGRFPPCLDITQPPCASAWTRQLPIPLGCIRNSIPSPGAGPAAMQDWKLCFSNTRTNETAVVTINSNNGVGVTTKLDFVGCS
jgi:Tfp pilus assembly protein PilE